MAAKQQLLQAIKQKELENKLSSRELADLEGVTIGLKQQIKAIKEKAKNTLKGLQCLEQMSGSSTELIESSDSLTLQTRIHQLIELNQEEFKVFIPYHRFPESSMVNVRKCCGCQKKFKSSRTGQYEKAFYIHCIKECKQYQDLGKIRKCVDCKLLFINQISFSNHISKHHLEKEIIRPNWLSEGHKIKYTFNSEVQCPGCKKMFPANKSYYNRHEKRINSVEFMKHCIEDCPQYKKLDLMRECKECKLIFLNYRALYAHKRQKHRVQTIQSRIEKWMPSRTNFYSIDGCNAKIQCKGCHKYFPATRKQNHYYYTIEFYKHCIKECSDYRKLGLISKCNLCEMIFLEPYGRKVHISRSHKEDLSHEWDSLYINVFYFQLKLDWPQNQQMVRMIYTKKRAYDLCVEMNEDD